MVSLMTHFSVQSGVVSNLDFLKSLNRDFPLVKTNKNIEYYNIPAAFDIEVSSFYDHERKSACMYIWQFGIFDTVTTGRTWEEFKTLLSLISTILELHTKRRLVVYIHNMSYEFQFIRKHLEWEEVFLLDERKPAYAFTNGIEFRCSMKLSGGKSLAKVGKDLQRYKVQKAVGDLDYSLVRTPLTPLTDKELGYCENDIRVLLSYIQEKIEDDGDISKIPLTNTGYVRNHCRKACFRHYRRYKNLMNQLTVSADEYKQLKRAFQGGFTHANAKYVGKVIPNVWSHDLASSYPTVMVLEKFPMSRARKITSIKDEDEFEYLLQRYCCMFDLELFDVVPKLFQDNPISASKCFVLEDAIENNGRVFSARRLKTTVTEQDFWTYAKFYDWSEMAVSNMRVYEKGYLPGDFVRTILKMYADKTSLKGIEEFAINYMISKNMINSAYGMVVTDINRKEFTYQGNEYVTTQPDVDANIDKYNQSKKRFLFYPWGVWVTAYARANLFSAIVELDSDYIYADTDSVKYINPEKHQRYFEVYSEIIHDKIEKAAKYHGINPDHFAPKKPDGTPAIIGIWDFDGIYDRFKTLGAKRYLTESNGKFSLTVAGTHKTKARDYLLKTGDPFGNFTSELCIPEEYSGRTTVTYIDEEISGTVVDYLGRPYNYHELSAIHMEPSDYNFSISDAFKKFLQGVEEIEEYG